MKIETGFIFLANSFLWFFVGLDQILGFLLNNFLETKY